MQNIIFYGLALILLSISLFKDRAKTKKSLIKAWRSFENILPQMLAMIFGIGLIIAFLSPELISQIIGGSSGWWGVVLAAVLGSVTLIPAFVAFPMAAILLQNGAGYMQLSAFVSTLTMVGVLTVPLEIKFFGRKFTIIRNSTAFLFSFLVALLIGKVMG
ncbi:MAG: permease [Firmicutes bacterium]|mgnify:CR=1 FL=1|nr:permease [Bacillota bacterium]